MKPRPHEPCSTPPMKPRERTGRVSIASAAPAGHSAPMPMPSSARHTKRTVKFGEKPAAKLASEYHRIEIMSGILRPTRSASQPDPTAPTNLSHRVTDSTNATLVKGTLNSCEIGTMISRNMVKSKASSVQPSQAAHHAFHCSLLGSFHQGISEDELSMADMARSVACRLFKKKLLAAWKAARKRGKTKKMNLAESQKRRQSPERTCPPTAA